MSYVIPEEVQKALHKADDAIVHARFSRQSVDYDFDDHLTKDEAQQLISAATEFLQFTKNYFVHLSADE